MPNVRAVIFLLVKLILALNNDRFVTHLDISEMLVKRSGLALIDDTHLWDMHRPLESDCEISFMHAQYLPDPYHFNRAYWRSCSLILGSVISKAFKNDIQPTLHSFPSPNGYYLFYA